MPASRFAGLKRTYEMFERTVVIALLVLLMAVVLWSTVALGIGIVSTVYARLVTGTTVEHSPLADVIANMHVLHDVFGGFLLILIGLELMKTVVMYLSDHEMHVEVVFTVAMIAIARHAIDLDLKKIGGLEMLGMASLIITLAVAYFLFKKTLQPAAAATPERSVRSATDKA